MRKLSKRILASRANGKLSRGPVTPAGLLRASANSTRHGLLAENLVLDEESKDFFALLHQQFIDRLNPADGVEVCLVEELASIVWRQRRLMAIETHLFKKAAARRPDQAYLHRLGSAFSELAHTPEMHLLDRYESRLHRMFQRSLKNLQLLREIEHTDPSTGELTQLPAEVTGIPDVPAELPNEPRSEQPPVESAEYPTTSAANNAENLDTEGGADFSLLPTGPAVPPQEAPMVPPAPPTTETHELPNEPRSGQPPTESTIYPTTSNPKPARHWSDIIDPITGRLRDVA